MTGLAAGVGIGAHYPEEAERRKHLGKFYYQPPSGESWADVVLRVRSLLNDLRHGFDGERVWMFTHQAVISTFRYVLEGLDEQELLLHPEREGPTPAEGVAHGGRAGRGGAAAEVGAAPASTRSGVSAARRRSARPRSRGG